MASAAKKPKSKKKPSPKGRSIGGNKAAMQTRILAFVEAMIQTNGNKTESARQAGHAGKWASTAGKRLSQNAQVIELLEKRRKQLASKYELTTEGVIRELARIAYFDPANCFTDTGSMRKIHDIDEDTRRALASYKEGEFKAFSKPEAIGRAMQYLGLIQKQNITNIAQAAAGAQLVLDPKDGKSMLEIGRRIAFTLSMAATQAAQQPPAPQPTQKPKEPA